MIKPLYDSKAEKLVFSYLNEFINTDYYSIHLHKPLYDIFEELQPHKRNEIFEQFCKLSDTEMFSDSKSELSHFDFVIYSDVSDMPVLIVEVNGSHHKTDPSQKNLDRFKKFICDKNDIPLLVLKLYKSYKDDEIRDMLKSNLDPFHSRNEFPVFCIKCNAIMDLKRNRKDGSFYYACSNPECKRSIDSPKPWTVSAEYIPLLLKES